MWSNEISGLITQITALVSYNEQIKNSKSIYEEDPNDHEAIKTVKENFRKYVNEIKAAKKYDVNDPRTYDQISKRTQQFLKSLVMKENDENRFINNCFSLNDQDYQQYIALISNAATYAVLKQIGADELSEMLSRFNTMLTNLSEYGLDNQVKSRLRDSNDNFKSAHEAIQKLMNGLYDSHYKIATHLSHLSNINRIERAHHPEAIKSLHDILKEQISLIQKAKNLSSKKPSMLSSERIKIMLSDKAKKAFNQSLLANHQNLRELNSLAGRTISSTEEVIKKNKDQLHEINRDNIKTILKETSDIYIDQMNANVKGIYQEVGHAYKILLDPEIRENLGVESNVSSLANKRLDEVFTNSNMRVIQHFYSNLYQFDLAKRKISSAIRKAVIFGVPSVIFLTTLLLLVVLNYFQVSNVLSIFAKNNPNYVYVGLISLFSFIFFTVWNYIKLCVLNHQKNKYMNRIYKIVHQQEQYNFNKNLSSSHRCTEAIDVTSLEFAKMRFKKDMDELENELIGTVENDESLESSQTLRNHVIQFKSILKDKHSTNLVKEKTFASLRKDLSKIMDEVIKSNSASKANDLGALSSLLAYYSIDSTQSDKYINIAQIIEMNKHSSSDTIEKAGQLFAITRTLQSDRIRVINECRALVNILSNYLQKISDANKKVLHITSEFQIDTYPRLSEEIRQLKGEFRDFKCKLNNEGLSKEYRNAAELAVEKYIEQLRSLEDVTALSESKTTLIKGSLQTCCDKFLKESFSLMNYVEDGLLSDMGSKNFHGAISQEDLNSYFKIATSHQRKSIGGMNSKRLKLDRISQKHTRQMGINFIILIAAVIFCSVIKFHPDHAATLTQFAWTLYLAGTLGVISLVNIFKSFLTIGVAKYHARSMRIEICNIVKHVTSGALKANELMIKPPKESSSSKEQKNSPQFLGNSEQKMQEMVRI